MNKETILAKIIKDKNLSNYFINKHYKKKSAFKYCRLKVKNFLTNSGLFDGEVMVVILLLNLMAGFGYLLSLPIKVRSASLDNLCNVLFPLFFIICNSIFLVGLLSVPYYICLTAKNFWKRKPTIFDIDIIDMKANLSIEDHEQIAKVLTREEFIYFIEHFKQYKDLPLSDIRGIAISYLKSERKKVENERQMKTLANKKEKLENYADVFYPK